MKFVFVVFTSEICGACKHLKAKLDGKSSAYDKIVSWVSPFVNETKDIVFPELKITSEYNFVSPAVSAFPTFMIFDAKTWAQKKLEHYSKFQAQTRDKATFENWARDVVKRIKQNAFNTSHHTNNPVSKQSFMGSEESIPHVTKTVVPKRMATSGAIQKSVITLLE